MSAAFYKLVVVSNLSTQIEMDHQPTRSKNGPATRHQTEKQKTANPVPL